ncbi:hypothetical protein NH340_JMT08708 [Sarcoptes scabiei]|nr:hypothetical protein NH340_JMT08708 [Sarcoptes scabiei]
MDKYDELILDIFKSTDESLQRVFNHKPFLDAELKSMAEVYDGLVFEKRWKYLDQLEQPEKQTSIRSILDGKKYDQIEESLKRIEKIEKSIDDLLSNEKSYEERHRKILYDYDQEQRNEFERLISTHSNQLDELEKSYANLKTIIENRYR